ncbi:MAG: helix-turn-helix domain-containing protein [Ruminococcaceae bacterium]|nr:helix-turn-helix domain-containing protein [Oscillospiraceae bacterium]
MNRYETHTMQDARLPFIFHRDVAICSDGHRSMYNWHENIEIIYAVSGSGALICDGERIALEAGDIAVINANRLHGFVAKEEPMHYYYLIIDRSFYIANHFDSNAYAFEEKLTDLDIARLIEEFGNIWTNEKAPMRVQRLRCIALDIATRLCLKYGHYEDTPRMESQATKCIKQAIGYMRAEGHRDISLDDISSFINMSKYYFAREFRRITGYSFVEYLNIIRCEKARNLLLQEDIPIGEVGKRCGFSNQSYFSRVFGEYAGTTPSKYRRNKKEKSGAATEDFFEN